MAITPRTRRIEVSNGKFASRERPPFIAINRNELRGEIRQDVCKFFRTVWLPMKGTIGMLRYQRWKWHIRAEAPQVASKHFYHCALVFEIFVRSEFRIIEISRKKIMPRLAYTDDIDLCFGNAVREFKNFAAGPLACNLAREIFCFC